MVRKLLARPDVIFALLFLLGAGIRAVDVWRPVDGTVRESWRECDIAAIARNYYREGMNLFYPRIDWRGDGPGYAEMEFPIYPWGIALFYKFFGFHEVIGRVLAYLFSLLALGLFFQLARHLLSQLGASAASLFFVISPLAVRISNSLQPEGLMLACYLCAVYSFMRWIENGEKKHYWIALASTSLAILTKANVAHIGFLFAVLTLRKTGLKALNCPKVWMFAAFSLLPAIAWYAYAHTFWLDYGNSLGLSNESHFAGWNLFKDPSFAYRVVGLDVYYAWMPTGFVIALFGIALNRSEKVVLYALWWLAAIFVYYLVAARTTGDLWAVYYHVVSVPPVALLFGLGVQSTARISFNFRSFRMLGAMSGALALLAAVAAVVSAMGQGYKVAVAVAFVIGLTAILVLCLIEYRHTGLPKSPILERFPLLGTLFCFLAVISVAGTFLLELRQIKWGLRPHGFKEQYECAKHFASSIPENALIIASGGVCKDEEGYPVAYNASYMFYWTDRKGFNICREQQSVEAAESLIPRGARYYIVEKDSIEWNPRLDADLRRAFKVVDECPKALLFDLAPEMALNLENGRGYQ